MRKPWESPYVGGGKIETPKETPKLRGCGDPNCAMCNPETAAANAGAVGGAGGGRPSMGGEMSGTGDIAFSQVTWTERASPQPRPNPEIREKVKDLIVETKHTVQWGDVVGNDAARTALIQAVEAATTHKDLYEFYGMKPPRGVLLYGAPGCGKTMFAKAAAARLVELVGAELSPKSKVVN